MVATDTGKQPEKQPEPEPEPEPREAPVPKTPALRHALTCTLSELFVGGSRRLAISRRVRCGDCSGSGTRVGREATVCEECHGEGRTTDNDAGFGLPMGMMRGLGSRPCKACAGTGQLMEGRDKCRRCRGAKQVLERKIVEVAVPAGSADKQRISVPGLSDEPVDGLGEPGDLVVTLAQRKHSCYSRAAGSDDLLLDLPIPLRTALCGGPCDIQTPGGKRLRFDCPAGLRPGDVRSIPGEGFPAKVKAGSSGGEAQCGRLLVRFAVTFPESMPTDAAEALSKVLPDASDAKTAPPLSGGEKSAAAADEEPAHEMVRRYANGKREPLLAEEYGGIRLGMESAAAIEDASVGELKAFLGKFGHVVQRGLEKGHLVMYAQRLYAQKYAERAERRSKQQEEGPEEAKTAESTESRVEEIPPTAEEAAAAEAAQLSQAAAPPAAVKLVAASEADAALASAALPADKVGAAAGDPWGPYGKGAGGFRGPGAGDAAGYEYEDYDDDEEGGGQQQQCSQQ